MNKALMDINDNSNASLWHRLCLTGAGLCVYTLGLCAVLAFKTLRLGLECHGFLMCRRRVVQMHIYTHRRPRQLGENR